MVFIHHHSPFFPNPSHPEAFLQVSPLSVTFLLQILIPAVFSYPFGSGSGNSSMFRSSGNRTIPVVPLHPPHRGELSLYYTLLGLLECTVSCRGLDGYTGLRLFLCLKGDPACLSTPSLAFQGSGGTWAPRTTPYLLPCLPFSPHIPIMFCTHV